MELRSPSLGMDPIQAQLRSAGKVRATAIVVATALFASTCSSTSEKRDFGGSDSAVDACVPIPANWACVNYTCGWVKDGCGGKVQCGDPYTVNTSSSNPCASSTKPNYWTCTSYKAAAPYEDCSPMVYVNGWCCPESS